MIMKYGALAAVALFALAGALLIATGATSIRHPLDDLIAMYFLAWGAAYFLCELPKRELTIRFLLITFSLVGLVGFFELGALLGLVDYRDVFSVHRLTFDLWNKPGMRIDPELLWIHEPHHRMSGHFMSGNIFPRPCESTADQTSYDLRYDHHGFRNATDLQRAEIAVIGDSYIESPMTPTAALLTSHLAELERKTVVNLGQSGYGPLHELAVLRRYALPLQPKQVIWVFFEGNDLQDIRNYKDLAATAPATTTALYSVWLRSFVRNLLFAAHTENECTPVGVGKPYAIVKDAEGQTHRTYFGHTSEALSAAQLEALDATRNVLQEAHQLCTDRGIRFLVVFAPIKFRVLHGIADFPEKDSGTKFWTVNDLPHRLHQAVSEISTDIPFLDLTPGFRDASKKRVLTFLLDDTHWSPEGHQLAASVIHQFLASGTP